MKEVVHIIYNKTTTLRSQIKPTDFEELKL